jgi:small-conductance mechanosensitive channel
MNIAMLFTQPLLLIPIAIVIGIVVEFGLLRLLDRRLEQSSWRVGRIIVHALQGQALWWLALLTPLVYFRTWTTPGTTLNQFLEVALAVGVTYSIVTVIVRVLVGWLEQDATRQKLATITLINNLIKIIGAIIFVLMVLSFLGTDLTPLLTLVVGSSLGLSLALQNPLSNLFAGIQIILTERVRPGHYVKLNSGVEGYVTDVRWTDTYIRTLTNNLVSVPNAEVSKAEITNYELPTRDVVIPMTLSVALDSDLEQVERVTLAVANEVLQAVVKDTTAVLRFSDMVQGRLTFTVYLRCHSFVEQFTLKHEFIKALSARYKA